MRNTLILIILSVISFSCSDDYAYNLNTINPEVKTEVRDSEYVNTSELNAIISNLLLNDIFYNISTPHSRNISENFQTTPVYRNGKILAYIVNFPNESGFAIISGTKNYYPILAYNNEGSFNSTVDVNHPSILWLEGITKMIEDQKFLKSDSLIKYHNIWEDAINSETSPLTIKSRSISKCI